MIFSFTGTREGMSTRQMDQFGFVIGTMAYPFTASFEFHYGGAKGADRQARNWIAELLIARGLPLSQIHCHPCPGVVADKDTRHDTWHEVFPPLKRDKDLAEICDVMIATPLTDKEVLRSGTWATIRYTRALMKPVVMLSRGKE